MKGLIQLAVLVIGGYLGYQYYRKNYSTEGKKEQADLLAKENANYQVIADGMKNDWRLKAVSEMNKILLTVPSFAGVRESMRQQLQGAIDKIYNETDWLALAKSGQEMPSFAV